MVLFDHDAHHHRNDNLGHVENFNFYFVFKIENKLF